MPLHKIPLCTFRYVGDNRSSATFFYDNQFNIAKAAGGNKPLEKNLSEMVSAEGKQLANLRIAEAFRDSAQQLINTRKTEVYKTMEVAFERLSKLSISKESLLMFTREINSISLDSIAPLYKIDTPKTINPHNNIYLSRNAYFGVSCAQFKHLGVSIRGLDTFNNKAFIGLIDKDLGGICIADSKRQLERVKDKFMNFVHNDFYFDNQQLRALAKNQFSAYIDRIKQKWLSIFSLDNYMDRLSIKDMARNLDLKGNIKAEGVSYKINSLKFTNDVTVYPIFNLNKTKLLYRAKYFPVWSFDEKYFDKLVLRNIFKPPSFKGGIKIRAIDIFTDKQKQLNKLATPNIFMLNSLKYGLKQGIDILKSANYGLLKCSILIKKYEEYSLARNTLGITKEAALAAAMFDEYFINKPSNEKGIEMINRWWVIDATAPEDKLILPHDYNYASSPLSVNSRILPYGTLVAQALHPISYMPYLEDLKGIDIQYGINEMDLSIEIMLEMINFIGLIVGKMASQFANCSGQEAIEFIMELILNWLNLEPIIVAMTNNKSREHYLRTYRWIRWEAEKVWFMADIDPTQDKMHGIKYSGMLFANLLEYMKMHHFNITPIWRNERMDIERNFNRKAQNGDLIKKLDKNKGKRHYSIENRR